MYEREATALQTRATAVRVRALVAWPMLMVGRPMPRLRAQRPNRSSTVNSLE